VIGSERKGLFTTMSAGNESSIPSSTRRRLTPPLASRPIASAWSSPNGIFRPWTLALVGLALSVSLWGFGYKLSRYNPDPSSRALFAKLWDKHQDVSQLTAVTGLSAPSPQSRLVVHTPLLLLAPPSNPARDAVSHDEDCKRTPASSPPAVPLRSPPSFV
jgi:hypothetical protein